MPELPEVETVRRALCVPLLGRRILGAQVFDGRLRWPLAQQPLARAVTQHVVVQIRRRAKYLLLDLAKEPAARPTQVVVVHLGMSGWLGVTPATHGTGRPAVARRPHEHVRLRLEGGDLLRYVDPRRFGSWHLLPADTETNFFLFGHLGPEPLAADFHGDVLWQAAHKSQRSIKEILMDGRVVVGVGNIYASEALFRSGIHPRLPGNRLSKRRAHGLVAAVRATLTDAIEVGGTTLRDFRHPDGLVGMFAPRLKIYGKKGQPCGVCAAPVKQFVQQGRSTFACFRCQTR